MAFALTKRVDFSIVCPSEDTLLLPDCLTLADALLGFIILLSALSRRPAVVFRRVLCP